MPVVWRCPRTAWASGSRRPSPAVPAARRPRPAHPTPWSTPT